MELDVPVFGAQRLPNGNWLLRDRPAIRLARELTWLPW